MVEVSENAAKVFIRNAQSGQYLFVLRDNKPDIAFPDTWGLIGGGAEPGESIMDCLGREVREEINIDIYNIRRVATIDVPFNVQGKKYRTTGHYYIADTDAKLEDVLLNEGQEIGYFTLEEILEKENVPNHIKGMINNNRDILR